MIVYNALFRGFLHLGAGLSVGLSGLAAGFAVGIVGDAGVRGTAQQPRYVHSFSLNPMIAVENIDKENKKHISHFRLYVGMILILIFAEVLGLYGLIVALIMTTKNGPNC